MATAVLVGAALVGSTAMAQTDNGADASSQVVAGDGQRVKNPDAGRTPGFAPQDIVVDGPMMRIAGANRFETAVLVAEAAGWTWDNAGSVFIASGADFPDALTMGPAVAGVGPLLLVRAGAIPKETAAALTELQPCFITVVGGASVVSEAVYEALADYAHPELCDAPQ